jgi:phosphinothricin acetyltransferase
MIIRPAVTEDLEAINRLYNHYVLHTHVTFDIEPISMASRREWFGAFAPDGPHRLLVGEVDGRTVGYASSSRFRPKAAYATSVESTVYLEPDTIGAGIGTVLYEALFVVLADEDVHRACAGITMPNDASVRLHEKFGFRRVGVFTEQGRKFGRYWDVAWYERKMP